MSEAVFDLNDAIDEVSIMYAKRQYDLAMSGAMDTRVHFHDAAQVLSMVYEIEFDAIYAQIQDEVRYQYSELVHKNLPKIQEIPNELNEDWDEDFNPDTADYEAQNPTKSAD